MVDENGVLLEAPLQASWVRENRAAFLPWGPASSCGHGLLDTEVKVTTDYGFFLGDP